MTQLAIPRGLCQCGCGRQTLLARKGDKRRGCIKGQPLPFAKGHTATDFNAMPPLCACGCGQRVSRAKTYDSARGRHRGDFNRFVIGHNARRPVAPLRVNTTVLCACGCGQLTTLARKTSTKHGIRKGDPLKYVYGHGRRRPDLDLIARFWHFVEKTDGCWNWTGASANFGYGVIANRPGPSIRAHRLSWEIAFGPIPAGQLVLHRCDNPRCVRPDHLFLGDHAANTEDKVQKRRQPHGERHPQSLLSDAAVIEIRRAPRDTATRRMLAMKFGVKAALICAVQARRTYVHVGESAA